MLKTKHFPLRLSGKSKLILTLLLAGLFFTDQTYAAEAMLTPSLGFQAEYNDNIDFTRTNERDDYISTISPGLKLDYKTERTVLGAAARVDVLNYFDYTDENTVNQNYGLNVSHKLFEKLGVRADGSYTRDRTTDTYLEETGLVSGRKTERQFYRGGAGLTYNLTEISDLDLAYSHSQQDYDTADKVDSSNDTVSLAYRYAFHDRRDILSIVPLYSRYDSDVTTTDNYGFSVGLMHRLHETLSMNLALGARYTDIELHNLGTTDSNWNWTADVSLTRSWETGSASIGYGRYLNYDDQGTPINVNRLFARANKNLTEQFGVSLAGSLYFSKSDGDVETQDSRFYEVTPSLYYNFTRDYRLEVGYSYANEDNKILANNSESERNRVWILLTFNFPYTF